MPIALRIALIICGILLALGLCFICVTRKRQLLAVGLTVGSLVIVVLGFVWILTKLICCELLAFAGQTLAKLSKKQVIVIWIGIGLYIVATMYLFLRIVLYGAGMTDAIRLSAPFGVFIAIVTALGVWTVRWWERKPGPVIKPKSPPGA